MVETRLTEASTTYLETIHKCHSNLSCDLFSSNERLHVLDLSIHGHYPSAIKTYFANEIVFITLRRNEMRLWTELTDK